MAGAVPARTERYVRAGLNHADIGIVLQFRLLGTVRICLQQAGAKPETGIGYHRLFK